MGSWCWHCCFLKFWWHVLEGSATLCCVPYLVGTVCPRVLAEGAPNSWDQKEQAELMLLRRSKDHLATVSHWEPGFLSSPTADGMQCPLTIFSSRDFFWGKMGRACAGTFPLPVLAVQEPGVWRLCVSFFFSSLLIFFQERLNEA